MDSNLNNPEFTKKFLQAKLAVVQAQAELIQILIDETDKNSQIGLADLQIEIEAIEGLDVLGPRRDIGFGR